MGTTAPTWDDLRVLLAVHRHRSFLAAGRSLKVSTSTVARRIEALEGSLGRALVHRGANGARVEAEAAELVALAEQLEHGIEAVKRGGTESETAGVVRISLSDGFVRPATHVLAEVRRAYPDIAIELASETRVVDLARREADFGIRGVRSHQPELVERAVGRIRFVLCASTEYVERRVRSARLRVEDLARHDFVGHDRAMQIPQDLWLESHGATRFPFRSNSDSAIEEATLQGQGLCLLADVQTRDNPRLVTIDIDLPLPTKPVFLVYHQELRKVARYRVVARALEGALKRGLA